jgi:hypothetical protein
MKYLNHSSFSKNIGKIFVLAFGLLIILFVFSIRPDTSKTKQYLSSSLSSNSFNNPDNKIAQAKNIDQERKVVQQNTTSSNNFDLFGWVGGIFNSENNSNSSNILSKNQVKNNSLNNFYGDSGDTRYNNITFPEITKDENNYKIESIASSFENSKIVTDNSFEGKIEWEGMLYPETVLSNKIAIGSQLTLKHLDKSLNIKITDWRIMDPEISIIVSRDIFEKLGGDANTQKSLNIQINKM